MDNPIEYIPLGLYVIRGDNVAIISDTTTQQDDNNNNEENNDNDIRAYPIKPVIQMTD